MFNITTDKIKHALNHHAPIKDIIGLIDDEKVSLTSDHKSILLENYTIKDVKKVLPDLSVCTASNIASAMKRMGYNKDALDEFKSMGMDFSKININICLPFSGYQLLYFKDKFSDAQLDELINYNYYKGSFVRISDESLLWLLDEVKKVDEKTFNIAIANGNIEILDKLLEMKCPCRLDVWKITTDTNVLDWLDKNGFPFHDLDINGLKHSNAVQEWLIKNNKMTAPILEDKSSCVIA